MLRGGDWYQLHWLWKIWLGVCACGFASLVWCAIRWQLKRRPTCLLSEDSSVFDVGRRFGESAIGAGKYEYMTKVPGNEFLQFEFVEKVYDFPLVGDRDELTILHLTDFHFTGIPGLQFYKSAIDRAIEKDYDLVVFTGDLLDDLELLAWFPETLGRLKARLGCYYILGNHDWSTGDQETRRLFSEAGWTDIASRAVVVPETNSTIVIGGSEVPWMGQHPNFDETPAAATRILLSHTPDNLEWAQENSVNLMLSGHNHGGQVVLPIIGPVYSPLSLIHI